MTPEGAVVTDGNGEPLACWIECKTCGKAVYSPTGIIIYPCNCKRKAT